MSDLTRKVLLLGTQALLLGTTSALLTIPASAIFLAEFGSGRLPYAYIAVAALGAVVSLRIGGALRRLSLSALAGSTMGGLTAIVVASWVLLRTADAVWTAFMLWVMFPMLIQLGFVFIGGQAQRLLDVRQIKRYFPRVVFGFAAGFLVGGVVAIPAAALMETRDMLLLTAASALALAGSFWVAGRRYRAELGTPDPPLAEGTKPPKARAVFQNRYVLLIFTYQFLSAAGSQIADFLTFDRAAVRYAGADQLASFFGVLTVVINLANIVFLALVAGFLMTRFGVRFGLMANPLVVAIVTAAALVSGAVGGVATTSFFLLAVGSRVLDIIFADGMTRTSVNATLQAVRPADRFAAQAAIEGIGVPAALGAVGVMLIVFDAIGAGTMVVTVSLGLVCLAWLGSSMLVFGGYRVNLAERIRRREIDPIDVDLTTPEAWTLVESLLESRDPSAVRVVFDLLSDAGDVRVPALATALLDDPNPDITVIALSNLTTSPDASDLALPLTTSTEATVRSAAYRLLCAVDRTVEAFGGLEDAEPVVRMEAAAALRRAGVDLSNVLRRWVESMDPLDRAAVAQIVGGSVSLEDGDAGLLARLRTDSDPAVVAAAVGAAAHHPDIDLSDAIPTRVADGSVAASIGKLLLVRPDSEPIIEGLLAGTTRIDGFPRWRAARAASGLEPPRMADLLLPHLTDHDRSVRHWTRRTLVERGSRLDPSAPELVACVEWDRRRAVGLMGTMAALGSSGHVLSRSLRDALADHAEDVALVGDLVAGGGVASRARSMILAGSATERATAVEIIEVTFGGELRRLVTTVFDPELDPADGVAQLDAIIPSVDRVLEDLVRGAFDDPWLQACAVWWCADHPQPALASIIGQLAGSAEPVVAETAARVRGITA